MCYSKRTQNTELGFSTTRRVFTLSMLAILAIHVFPDPDSSSNLALSTFVIMINNASVLSPEKFDANKKETNDENSNYSKEGVKNLGGAFRVCFLSFDLTRHIMSLNGLTNKHQLLHHLVGMSMTKITLLLYLKLKLSQLSFIVPNKFTTNHQSLAKQVNALCNVKPIRTL